METASTPKKFDLQPRTLAFGLLVRDFVHMLPHTVANKEYGRQLTRSAGSIGANYIEANGALGTKNFLMHLKISRKESRETWYWLNLVETCGNEKTETLRLKLLKEADEFIRIFTSIIFKFKAKNDIK
jgi:four helix bundle protein